MRITHVVVTENFAGTERYVCEVARTQASLGHQVTVVGGAPARMRAEAGSDVRWLPGSVLTEAVRALVKAPRSDIVHAHLTAAESAALVGKAKGARLVSTRHIAARRGSSRTGALAAPLLRQAVDVQIAISDFVARAVDGRSTVLHNGVLLQDDCAALDSRTLLVCQRLEAEKDTALGLRAFAGSGLATEGWRLAIAGDGAERADLERLVQELDMWKSVTFLGFVQDVRPLMLEAAALLAPAPAEPLGLTVLEAMALGLPVVAAAGGGHLETVATVEGAVLFAPGDASAGAAALHRFGEDPASARTYGVRCREVQRSAFDLAQHVQRLLARYAAVD